MKTSDFLKEYHKKRDFDRTSEPFGDEGKSSKKSGGIFVIQQHEASNLHYDFRLEVDGVLKSWAVPKGPSTDPSDKRLAVQTEDHPLEYADFEGIIPEGEYGGGTVMVWDAGTYKNINNKDDKKLSMDEAIENGHILFWLDGKKIKGGYALIRIGKGKNKNWLLIKKNDEKADARRNTVSTQPNSVLSGRTLRQIRDDSKNNQKQG
jgi:DNA ligase D-like protein (predicted 3'-phosphoesterase)